MSAACFEYLVFLFCEKANSQSKQPFDSRPLFERRSSRAGPVVTLLIYINFIDLGSRYSSVSACPPHLSHTLHPIDRASSMLTWEKLLNNVRRKDLHQNPESAGTAAGRTEIERDYDRILFSTPTRRLADKTQVFPMEVNDSVRTRLTHSHEVSNLARSIGVRLAFDHAEIVFGAGHERLQVKRNVPALLAAVGLGHDLGNPPFGHQGEIAIQQWFKEGRAGADVDSDFTGFDGNAQTF
jgi:HD domain